jgi:hypothetical protein
MSDPAAQPERANRFDDPTRDIRLTSAPGTFSVAAGSPTRAERLAAEPTDELVPPASLVREPTLKFEQGSGAPLAPPAVSPAIPPARRARKWPFLVLALIPVLVIVGSGIWLLVLISHG